MTVQEAQVRQIILEESDLKELPVEPSYNSLRKHQSLTLKRCSNQERNS
jgi:hypothetical protein